MKTIGLIGGMSWQSSKLYYEFLNTRANELLGGSHSAKCILVSVDFAEIERLSFENKWEDIGVLMANSAKQLEKAGADIVLLGTNTIHLVSDAITENISIPFLHIAEATGEVIQKKGLKKVLLLGTKFTMEKNFYTKLLEDIYGLEVMIPEIDDRQLVHDIIYNELVKGKFLDTSRKRIIEIIKKEQSKGAQGVILGCTELPILIAPSDVEIPTFDTGKIHAHKAMEWANE
ncbi:MAG: aspartate racemase [Flavobacteriaceae bacterium]|nr:MAG: aspartate racemase [Flavobacteriaceae bacterium]